jgi:hypothetical protein
VALDVAVSTYGSGGHTVKLEEEAKRDKFGPTVMVLVRDTEQVLTKALRL